MTHNYFNVNSFYQLNIHHVPTLNADFDRYVFLVLDLLKSFGSDLMKTDEPNHEEKHGEGQQEQSDEETEYLDKLRTGLLECYSAIIQGLRVSKRHDLVLSAMDTIHHLLQHCAEHFATAAASADADSDKKASWECKKAAWGLLLDVVSVPLIMFFEQLPIFSHRF